MEFPPIFFSIDIILMLVGERSYEFQKLLRKWPEVKEYCVSQSVHAKRNVSRVIGRNRSRHQTCPRCVHPRADRAGHVPVQVYAAAGRIISVSFAPVMRWVFLQSKTLGADECFYSSSLADVNILLLKLRYCFIDLIRRKWSLDI